MLLFVFTINECWQQNMVSALDLLLRLIGMLSSDYRTAYLWDYDMNLWLSVYVHTIIYICIRHQQQYPTNSIGTLETVVWWKVEGFAASSADCDLKDRIAAAAECHYG